MGLFSKRKKPNQETSEEKEKWADTQEERKFVIQGGKVQCAFCTMPDGDIIVTSNTISLQGKYYATTADCNGATNLDFKGQCTAAPGISKPPCKSVIQLGKWKDYSETMINDDNALLVQSTIPCMISGEYIKITHSGQIEVLTEIDPMQKSIKDAYWMTENSNKKKRTEYPDYPVTLYLRTMGYKTGETATVKIKSNEGKTFEGGQTELTVSGIVNNDKLVIIEDFKITYEKEG